MEIDFLNSFILDSLDSKNSLLGDKIYTNQFRVMMQFYHLYVYYKNHVFGEVTKEIRIQAMVMWRIFLDPQRRFKITWQLLTTIKYLLSIL